MKKIIQINSETNEILETGVLAAEGNPTIFAKMNEELKRIGSKKLWLIEPSKQDFPD